MKSVKRVLSSVLSIVVLAVVVSSCTDPSQEIYAQAEQMEAVSFTDSESDVVNKNGWK